MPSLSPVPVSEFLTVLGLGTLCFLSYFKLRHEGSACMKMFLCLGCLEYTVVIKHK